jgi:hypothetical protein
LKQENIIQTLPLPTHQNTPEETFPNNHVCLNNYYKASLNIISWYHTTEALQTRFSTSLWKTFSFLPQHWDFYSLNVLSNYLLVGEVSALEGCCILAPSQHPAETPRSLMC